MKIKERIHFALNTPDYLRVFFLRVIGNFLILSSLFMIGKTFATPLFEEAVYAYENAIGKKYVVAQVTAENQTTSPTRAQERLQEGGLARLLNIKPQVESIQPVNTDFSIVIPKIGANANIIANVNAADESEYLEDLKHGVAHTRGTAFPGEGGHIFLFAHSTDYIWNVNDYNAVFYLLYKLTPGDEINIFYKGQRIVYRVEGNQVVNPDEVGYITRKTDGELLTLQTCWPPGTSLARLLVFAKRVAT